MSSIEKISYSLGVSIVKNLKSQGIDTIDAKEFTQAVEDVFAGKDLKISEEESTKIIQDYFQGIQKKMLDANHEEGLKFLEENKNKDGITTLESGLQYKIITAGEGEMPKAEETVTTHYHGTLINGTVFDSSVERGEPASFPVNGVIAGWTEALQLMPVGAKWQLFIPHQLAYGEKGAGQMIMPFTTLVFEVELLSINN